MADEIIIGSQEALYFGEPDAEGTWRIVRNGESLSFQRLESGEWVKKLSINP